MYVKCAAYPSFILKSLALDFNKRRRYLLLHTIDVTSANSITGGRYTPFMANYKPQLFARTADTTVALSFPEGTPNPEEKMVCSVSIPEVYF